MDRRLTGLDLKTSLSAIADLVLPRECVVCGRILMPGEDHICLTCLADLPETHFETMSHNPMADRFNARIIAERYEPYAYATALFHYAPASPYSNITKALKYHRNFGAGKYFSRMLGQRLAGSPLFADADLILPVPLHWSRRWSRGYNQAEIIADELGKVLGCKVRKDILKRSRRTRTQTELSMEEKQSNVAGAFRLCRNAGEILADCGVRHILIVDDVFTSGATAAECHRLLRKAIETQRAAGPGATAEGTSGPEADICNGDASNIGSVEDAGAKVNPRPDGYSLRSMGVALETGATVDTGLAEEAEAAASDDTTSRKVSTVNSKRRHVRISVVTLGCTGD